MKKIMSYLLQWLVLIALAVPVGRAAFRRAPPPETKAEDWRNWEGFHVLSYAGLARHDTDPEYATSDRLGEHLAALRKAGYRTISPAEAEAFLAGRAPLPGRSLLLIFEGGRKDAFIRATPLLQREGYRAALAIPTQFLNHWSGFFLGPRDLRKIAQLPWWDVGSMGHRAVNDHAGRHANGGGHYLSRRRSVNGHTETDAEFSQRILADYETSASELAARIGRPPPFFLYPFADAGAGPEADPLAERINRDAVTRLFRMAFSRAGQSFNGAGSDPWALTRLRVRGDWSGDDLLARLEQDRPANGQTLELGTAEDWRMESGAEWADRPELTLPAGSLAWRRRTANWSDGEIRVALTPDAEGIAAVYARYRGPRSYVRAVLEPQGIRLQERLPDRLQTLAWIERPSGGPAALSLRLRGNRLWLSVDGRAAAGPVPLTARTGSGMLGCGGEAGSVAVTAFHAEPHPVRWILADQWSSVEESRRDTAAAWLPVMFNAGEPSRVSDAQSEDLLKAAAAGVETIPVVCRVAECPAENAEMVARAVDAALRARNLHPLVRRVALDGRSAPLADAFRALGYPPVHIIALPEADAMARSLMEAEGDDAIVLRDIGPPGGAVMAHLQHLIPSRRWMVAGIPSDEGSPGVQLATRADYLEERP
ncbi:MAG: polysaccharide deacetylase family protein [Kiritimatiellae bacterium]|nr:polysaccharide deacetylase family protein [Kiritimatiellia bacterium]